MPARDQGLDFFAAVGLRAGLHADLHAGLRARGAFFAHGGALRARRDANPDVAQAQRAGHGAENTKILKSPSDPLFPRRLRRLQNDLVTRYRANPDGLRGHVGRALAIAISG